MKVLEIQRPEDVQNEVNHLAYLFLNLVDGAKYMRIVLRETTHAGQPM